MTGSRVLGLAEDLAVHGAGNTPMLAADIENVIGARIHVSGRPTLFGPLDVELWEGMTPFTYCQRRRTVFSERPLREAVISGTMVRAGLIDMLHYRLPRRANTDDTAIISGLIRDVDPLPSM